MKKIYFLLLCFVLINCSTSKPSSFYNIIAIQNNDFEIKNDEKVTIGIKQAVIPNYLNRPQIITIKNGVEFTVSESNRWLESLQYSIQRAVVNNISNYSKNFTVKSINFENDKFDFTIQIEINGLDGNFNNFVELDAFYTIKDKNNKIEIRHVKLRSNIFINNSDYAKLVNEYNLLIEELSKNIAKDIVNW